MDACDLFGHLLNEPPRERGCPTVRRGRRRCHSRTRRDSGLPQPVSYQHGLQKSAGQFSFTELTAAIPISLRINCLGNQGWERSGCAREPGWSNPESGSLPGFGVGLVSAFSNRRLGQPASVDVLIDQQHFGRVPRQVRTGESAVTLQACIRNLSASCAGSGTALMLTGVPRPRHLPRDRQDAPSSFRTISTTIASA